MRSKAACGASCTPHKQSGTFSQKDAKTETALREARSTEADSNENRDKELHQANTAFNREDWLIPRSHKKTVLLSWYDRINRTSDALLSVADSTASADRFTAEKPSPQIDTHVLCLGPDDLQYTPKPLNQQLRGVYGDAFWHACFINKPCLESELS